MTPRTGHMERPKARLTQHRQKRAEIHTAVGSKHLSKTVEHHVRMSSSDYTTMLKLSADLQSARAGQVSAKADNRGSDRRSPEAG